MRNAVPTGANGSGGRFEVGQDGNDSRMRRGERDSCGFPGGRIDHHHQGRCLTGRRVKPTEALNVSMKRAARDRDAFLRQVSQYPTKVDKPCPTSDRIHFGVLFWCQKEDG